jgi:hypothetical protein
MLDASEEAGIEENSHEMKYTLMSPYQNTTKTVT